MTDPTPDDDLAERAAWSWSRTALTVGLSAGILVISLLCVGLIQLTEPEAEKEGAVKRTAMLVEVQSVERGDYTPTLVALGSVRPNQDVRLEPRVSGQVVSLDDQFVPGRVVEEGTPLIRIDPADAANVLAQRRSALQQAEADLALEKGRQAVARTERNQIQGEISPEQEALILRQPQLEAAQARVASARAALTQAELDLGRTTVRAPFDALVLDRTASVGSQVGPGQALGRLVGVDRFWVELTLPVAQLKHLDLSEQGATVELRDRAAWPPGTTRTGRVDGVIRQVDDQTRLARVLVAVDDPLALADDAAGPALLAGSWVEARIGAAELTDVVRIDRSLLRKGGTVWVMTAEDTLDIRSVELALEDAQHAYVSDGLAPGDRVVTTNLATVTQGAALRTGAAP